MFLRITTILALFFSGLAIWADELDLTNCYELALTQSERVGIAAAQWKEAEARYQQAHDTWFPDVSLDGTQLYRNNDSGSTSATSRNLDDVSDVRFTASQPIYRGFRLTKLAEAREADVRAAEFDQLRVNELLYLDVADAFYLLLSLQREHEILKALEQALNDTIATFEERIKRGQSRRADLLKAQTDLAEALVDVSSVSGQIDAARQLMSFLTGLPSDKIVVREQKELPESIDVTLYQTSIVNRLDIKAGEARTDSARLEVEAAKGSRQPSLDAQAGYILYERPDEDRIWEVGFALTFPLFDDGFRRSLVREQMATAEISELNLSQLRRQADLEVKNRIVAWQTSVRQLDLLRNAVTVAKENYTVQQDDYLLGRSTQLDALTALAQWHRLRLRESNADVVARLAYAALKVAAGVPVP